MELNPYIKLVSNSLTKAIEEKNNHAAKYYTVESDFGQGYNAIIIKSNAIDLLPKLVRNEVKKNPVLIRISTYKSQRADAPAVDIREFPITKKNNINIADEYLGGFAENLTTNEKLILLTKEYEKVLEERDELLKENAELSEEKDQLEVELEEIEAEKKNNPLGFLKFAGAFLQGMEADGKFNLSKGLTQLSLAGISETENQPKLLPEKSQEKESESDEYDPVVYACIEYLEVFDPVQLGTILAALKMLFDDVDRFDAFYNCAKNNFGLTKTEIEVDQNELLTELGEKFEETDLRRLIVLKETKPELLQMLRNMVPIDN